MSALDKDSGVRNIPTPTCPRCHHKVYITVAGRMIHTNPRSTCGA